MLGIYCRISREKDTQDRSIEDQKLRGIELAKSLNIDYKIYIDEGISGTKGIDERPSLSALIDDIYSKDITIVYVYDQSRLERSLEARFAINKVFKDENIQLYTDNGLVGTDIEDEFTGDILSVINNFYVKMTSKKVKAVMRRNMLEGKSTGKIAYGYTIDNDNKVIVDTYKASVVRDIYNMSISGLGARRIALKLREMNIPPPAKAKWSEQHIFAILKNTIYKGIRTYGGVDYPYPSIIEPEVYENNRIAMKSKSTKSGPVVKGKYLLREVLKCSCGARMVGRDNKRLNAYTCSTKRYIDKNCNSRSVNRPTIDEFIKVKMMSEGRLEDLIIADLKHKPTDEQQISLDNAKRSLEALKTRLNRLVDAIADGIIDKDDAKAKITDIKRKITRKKSEIDVIKAKIDAPQHFKASLDSDNVEKLVDYITVEYIEKSLYYVDIKIIKNHRYILDTKNKCAYRDSELIYLTGFTGNVLYKLKKGAAI